MFETPKVNIYLHEKMRKRVAARKHNYFNKLIEVLEMAGYEVAINGDSLEELLIAPTRPGHSIVLMEKPINEFGLTTRLTYIFPFWHIEKTHERWNWPVAQAKFDPQTCPKDEAINFTSFWRDRHFGKLIACRDGFVYLPLQGKLSVQRSFQYCSPLEMIEHVLEHDPKREVIASLHPKEKYQQHELDALEKLNQKHPRLTVETGDMGTYLPYCDYVVTQNSSVAFLGYFLYKPAVLFGKIDFHHIAANVFDLGPEQAIKEAPHMKPDFDSYIWWFLQKMSINAGRPEATEQIEGVLRSHQWPI